MGDLRLFPDFESLTVALHFVFHLLSLVLVPLD